MSDDEELGLIPELDESNIKKEGDGGTNGSSSAMPAKLVRFDGKEEAVQPSHRERQTVEDEISEASFDQSLLDGGHVQSSKG